MCLLSLSKTELDTILGENENVRNAEHAIASHMHNYKTLHPTAIADPDEPPKHEIVKAISFLKQQRLPGSLLGKWQFPLPSPEVFKLLVLFSKLF